MTKSHTTVQLTPLGDRITTKIFRDDRFGGVVQEDIIIEMVVPQTFEFENERKSRHTKQDRQKNWPSGETK